MKFEELREKIQNPSQEQIDAAIKESISACTNMKELNDFLIQFHPNDAYKVIRDFIQPNTNMVIRHAKNAEKNTFDNAEYRRFQEIQQEAKRMFDYFRRTATMFDLNQIAEMSQRYYSITVRMISKVDDELGKIEAAINRIEEHIGLDVTKFEEDGEINDTTDGDKQGEQETTE